MQWHICILWLFFILSLFLQASVVFFCWNFSKRFSTILQLNAAKLSSKSPPESIIIYFNIHETDWQGNMSPLFMWWRQYMENQFQLSNKSFFFSCMFTSYSLCYDYSLLQILFPLFNVKTTVNTWAPLQYLVGTVKTYF